MTSTRSTRLLAAATALALTATACAGSNGPDPTAERELEEFQNTTTAAPATTTQPSPATEAPAITSSSPEPTLATDAHSTIVVIPATDAPTTTTDEPADPRDAEVEAALQEFSNAWVRCAEASPNCDPTILDESVANPQLQALVDVVVAGNTNGETVSNLDSYQTHLQSITYVDDSFAEVKACSEDGLVVRDRSGNVVNDRFSSALTIWTLELIEGAWKITTGRELRRVNGKENTLCESR